MHQRACLFALSPSRVIPRLTVGAPATYNILSLSAIQELNPLPFLGIVANCVAWLLYGTLIKDPYVYFSNILGLPLGCFYVLTTLKFATGVSGGCLL